MRLALLLATAIIVPAQNFPVQSHTLSNGMKIIVQEDHDIPNVALYFFYKIGSRNERPGITGISHFFEHMMFNGAKKYGPKQFDFEMEKRGGHNNAYTSRDLTVYSDWFPSNMLETMFDMEADRIRDLAFDPQIIESERGVVASERRLSVENSNAGLLSEQLDAAAYTAHPYGWPVVGWMSDIESWTMDDLKAHYRMGYAPDNCIAVISGDVALDQAITLAKKYLEPIPKQALPPPVRTIEPPQQGERRVVLRKPAQLPMLMVSYHTPSTNSKDTPALDVLDTILSNGRSSRLYQRLVDRDQLAFAVESRREFSLDPGQAIFFIQPKTGITPEQVEKALYEELDRVAKEGPTEAELAKAGTQLLSAHYRELSTISGKANQLGRFEVYYGSSARVFTIARDWEQVTVGDVKRVASRFFGASNRTVAMLIPEASK
jgi:zinc protease